MNDEDIVAPIWNNWLAAETINNAKNMATISCGPLGTCIHCKKTSSIKLPWTIWQPALLKMEEGMLIQNALPNLDPEIREQIISGTHPECWSNMFSTNKE